MDETAPHCGPDQLLPASENRTWLLNEAVKILADDEDLVANPPISVVTALKRVAEHHPERLALVDSNGDREVAYTYERYYEAVVRVAKALIKLGLESDHAVGIIGSNSPHWFITYMATIFAGGVSLGLYPLMADEIKKNLLNKAKCNIVVVEDDTKVQSILNMWDSLPHLKAIIQYRGKPKEELPKVYAWDDLIRMNLNGYDEELKGRILNIAPNKCCTLIATSGTTGTLKTAMLSHDNFTWSVKMFMNHCYEGKTFPPEVILSYQTLCHVTALITDVYWPLMCGGATVHIAEPDVVERSLVKTLRRVRPTLLLGVPRIWELLMEHSLASEINSGRFRKLLVSWARMQALNINKGTMAGNKTPSFDIAKRMVLKKMAAKIGLDRCRIAIVGVSATKREILEFFWSIDVPLMESYGMTESGGITINTRSSFKLGSVGHLLGGLKIKLQQAPNADENLILITGRNVFMGYLEDETKTRDAFDHEGYFRTADLGVLDEDDFLILSGRSSDLIIKKDSRKICPSTIEHRVLSFMPCLSHCIVVGEGQEFLHVLLVLKTKSERIGEPTDILDDLAVEWCRSIGVDAKKLSDICNSKHPKLVAAIQEVIEKTNAGAWSEKEWIKNWRILPEGFSVKGGELGVTMKVKRPLVHEKYKKIIQELYEEQ